MHAGVCAWPVQLTVPAGWPVRVGVPLADVYLEFLAGRCRPNTVLAAAYDLKVFFTVVGKPPEEVAPADVLAFITAQRTGAPAGMACCRRWTATASRPGCQPRRCAGACRSCRGSSRSCRPAVTWWLIRCRGGCRPAGSGPVPRQGVPLVRATRRLPRILSPAEVDALTAALRTHRDRAMVAAMVLGGLRRCEVLGLRLDDLRVAERRVFIAEGKGGRQRLIPVSGRFFAAVGRLPGRRTAARVPAPTGSSWCSRDRAAGSRCRPRGPMRSWPPRGAGPGWTTRPATSCGIPA